MDSGEGIHHEIIPRLFTKFASRSNSGTGLDLSKSIVELMEVEYGPKIILMGSELRFKKTQYQLYNTILKFNYHLI